MNIIKSSTSMKSKPSITSCLETECLYGETIEILDDFQDWVYCRLNTDNYYGWVKKSDIGKLGEATHRVINIRSFIYKDTNVKSNVELYLPMGSNLVVEKIVSGWAQIYYPINNIYQIGYVPIKHLTDLQKKNFDWVAIAESLKGTPYKWGGRDTVGLDCSALLQLAYQTYGENIPRNTAEQVKLKKSNLNQLEDLYRGSVVFWKGHVGIMIDKANCIHANAYHMKTVTEPLCDIINRMEKGNDIVKMMDFN